VKIALAPAPPSIRALGPLEHFGSPGAAQTCLPHPPGKDPFDRPQWIRRRGECRSRFPPFPPRSSFRGTGGHGIRGLFGSRLERGFLKDRVVFPPAFVIRSGNLKERRRPPRAAFRSFPKRYWVIRLEHHIQICGADYGEINRPDVWRARLKILRFLKESQSWAAEICSLTISLSTVNSPIVSLSIRPRRIARRPMASAPIASAPMAVAPSANPTIANPMPAEFRDFPRPRI
jgi:hypothetical protein